jgi:Domain of unknown function (DUF4129)
MMSRRPGVCILLPLLILGLSATAQRGDDAPQKKDTTLADTVVVGAGNTPASPGIDTSIVSGNSESSGTVTADPVVFRTVPDSAINRWKNNRRFAYANDPDYWRRHKREEKDNSDSWLRSNVFSYLVYTLLAGILLFAIVRIISENNGLFYRRRSRQYSAGGDGETETPETEDLDERIQYYLDRNDHRRAVRYLYLRTLRNLNDRGLIRYDMKSTNQEYLRQLRATPREASFRFLTGAYEKVWYGEFPLSDHSFRSLHQYFTDFDKSLPS